MIDIKVNEFFPDEKAPIYINAKERFSKGDYLFTVTDDGLVEEHKVTQVERGWYGYLLGGPAGIYRYTYVSKAGKSTTRVANGAMFKSKASALLHYVDNLRRKVNELGYEIEQVNGKMGSTLDEIHELINI